jgi:DNA mismatch repair protein MutS2
MRAAEKYRSLEFDRLLEQLAGYARSPVTRELVRNLSVVFHPARVDENLDQTEEAVRLSGENAISELPDFGQLDDVEPLWQRIAVGELIDKAEARALLRFFALCGSFTRFLRRITPSNYPRLNEASSGWDPLSELTALTQRIFNEDGEVRDNASPELRGLREKIREYEGDAQRVVREILSRAKQEGEQDATVTVRNNRFVLQVPRSFISGIKGSVVDISGHGNFLYFEPQALSLLNTQRQHLFIEESQEVQRILRQYGLSLAGQLAQLQSDLGVLLRFDYIFARARYGQALRATRPLMNTNGVLSLEDAVHPLIRGFVPETIRFERHKALVISGVNAGGKTVLLKLQGVYCLLAALGCLVPGRAQIPYVSDVLADIGDEQSTLNNLSTFTAHLDFISRLWQELDSAPADGLPYLVLIDEIGTGTSPGEGAAFAYGLIKALLSKPVKLAVTTHYDLLKTLGLEHPELVRNASLEFDEIALKPTFHIVHDMPGQSFALAIAERWGIDPAVMESAQGVLGREEEKMALVIGQLERLRRDARDATGLQQRKAAELEEIRQQNAALTEELRIAKQKLARQMESVKSEVRTKVEALLTETKHKLKKKARDASRKHDEYVKAASKTSQLARRQSEMIEGAVDEITAQITADDLTQAAPSLIQLGMQVRVADSRLSGEVLEINAARGEAVIGVFGKRVGVKLSRLVPAAESGPSEGRFDPVAALRRSVGAAPDRAEASYSRGMQDSSDTIDLHGMTVEEAQEYLDEFINRAILSNVPTIRVMHGVGTGRLRTFVQDYLRSSGQASNVRQAGVHEGGVGVTLADLN